MMLRRTLALCSLVLLLVAPSLAFGQAASPFPINRTATLQSAAVATGNGNTLDTARMAIVTFQVSGTLTSLTVTFEGSNDNSAWNSLTCFTLDSATSASSASATGIWRCNIAGIALVRARVSAYVSGTVTVVANASSASNAIRDQITLSGAITGQLRGTQTTAPTCGSSDGAGNLVTFAGCQVTGTDSFMRGLVGTGLPAKGNPGNLIVTFNAAYAAAPACVATRDGAGTYGYYVYAVTPTTTTATIKLGGGTAAASLATWSPGDAWSMICAGTQ